ncbi:Uncharacterized protein Adt_27569 [Abeliophyllum distichum]|uniref:SWIM-type domain-containing protein n=1 Tax=Abeliophyllum distichum TaxID=126358 RepID=A0ABD1RUT9_9LAMI
MHTLWNAARATTMPMWQNKIEDLKELNNEAYEWLDAKSTSQWSRSHFRESSKCDILLNNLCEAFNSSIVNAWEKPILSMLEQIRFNLMIRMVNKKEEDAKWKTDVGPRIVKIVEKNRKALRYLYATYSGDKRFEIRHIYSGHINAVDLVAKTCSCRSWQLSGVSCGHVICSLESRRMSSDLMLYVSDCYKKDAYWRTYLPSICPMTGPELWPNPSQHPLAPPPIKKMPGRPKKVRQRKQDEKLGDAGHEPDTNHGSVNHGPVGTLTRSRAKKIKEDIQGLVKTLWTDADIRNMSRTDEVPTWVHLIQAKEGVEEQFEAKAMLGLNGQHCDRMGINTCDRNTAVSEAEP